MKRPTHRQVVEEPRNTDEDPRLNPSSGGPTTPSPALARLLRIGRFLAQGWIIVGLSVVVLIGMEVTYRTQGALRRAVRDDARVLSPEDLDRSPLHPNADTHWWADYAAGRPHWSVHFDPYRGIWADSITGTYINIDSLGRRATYDPTPVDEPVTDIWMFGGSAMWGYLVRDRYTIPSLVAEDLQRRGLGGVRVHNLAQSTFNLTQEVNSLILELRAGRVPDLVVFLDGNNEVAPAFQSREVGMILNQERLTTRLNASPPGFLTVLATKLQLVQRLTPSPSPPEGLDDAPLCAEIAWQYANLTDVARGLGSSYGFASRFYWQPMLAISGKPRTEWEESVSDSEAWGSLVSQCTAAVDDSMQARGYGDYRSLGALFDSVSGPVFIDDFGHMTEDSNHLVAKAIVDDLVNILGRR
jgi:hypothetical protein